MDRCIISNWEVALGAPDRVNIPCLMHDTRLCQLDVKMTNNSHTTGPGFKIRWVWYTMYTFYQTSD